MSIIEKCTANIQVDQGTRELSEDTNDESLQFAPLDHVDVGLMGGRD